MGTKTVYRITLIVEFKQGNIFLQRWLDNVGLCTYNLKFRPIDTAPIKNLNNTIFPLQEHLLQVLNSISKAFLTTVANE